MIATTKNSKLHAIVILVLLIWTSLNLPKRRQSLKLDLKVNSTPPNKFSPKLLQPRPRKPPLTNKTSMNLMPKETSQEKNSNRRLMNTTKQPPPSVKLVDYFLKVSVPHQDNQSSFREVKSTPRPPSPPQLPPSSRSISLMLPILLPRTSTERLMPRSSRSSPPSHPELNNLPTREPSESN